jgi:hypothetical protein
MMSSKSKKHRTKEQMAKDVLAALNAPMSYRAKEVVLLDVFSAWTESEGKYNGCPYWSERAWELHRACSWEKNVRHEHAIPKKVLRDLLLRLESLTEETVATYLDFFLIGVVVTIEEDERLNDRFKSEMPDTFWKRGDKDYLDRFARYKVCGIMVGKVERIPYGKRIWRNGVGRPKVRLQWEPLPDTQVPVAVERTEEFIETKSPAEQSAAADRPRE